MMGDGEKMDEMNNDVPPFLFLGYRLLQVMGTSRSFRTTQELHTYRCLCLPVAQLSVTRFVTWYRGTTLPRTFPDPMDLEDYDEPIGMDFIDFSNSCNIDDELEAIMGTPLPRESVRKYW
jgi:hypothetical protein